MPRITIFYVSYAALWGLVLFQALVLIELVRQRQAGSEPQRETDTSQGDDILPSGTVAPAFEAKDVRTGQRVESTSWLGLPTLLTFVSPSCSFCELFADELANFRRTRHAHVVTVCRGDDASCAEFVSTHFPETIAVADQVGTVAHLFGVNRTPTVVLLDSDGHVLRYGSPSGEAGKRPEFGLASFLQPSADGAASQREQMEEYR